MLELILIPLIGIQSQQNPLLTNEYQIVVEAPTPELSLEEKIKQNINNCDQALYYISAEDASCIPKPIKKATTQPLNSSQGLNGYVLTSCTGWVATHRYVPPGWGNATNWKWHAQNAGWYVGPTPVKGAIGWTYGHVVYVESVNGDGTVTISERNYDWAGSIRTVTRPATNYTYLY